MMTLTLLTAGAEKMAVTDPHGWTLTTVCVLVVFGCLLILYGMYSLMGAVLGKRFERKSQETEHVENEEIPHDTQAHDVEPGIITIKTRGWSGKDAGYTVDPASVQQDTSGESAAKNSDSKHRTLRAPLPGVIIEISVRVGEQVKRGQKIAVLEAMKMENDILSEREGIVTAIFVNNGDSLHEGDKVARIE